MTEQEVVERLREECRCVSQRAWARSHGFAEQFVSDVLKGRRSVSEKLAEALGFRREVRFFPK